MGLPVVLRERPCPRWTVAFANDLMFRRLDDQDALTALAACPLLSLSWRETLGKRLESGSRSNLANR